jgi:hypothetical protein
MDPLAVDLVLLRTAAPDLPIVVGRVLSARVVERNGRHGILNLAGAILTAELPDEVQVGDRLRLVVRETTPERVVFQQIVPAAPPPLAAPPPPPGGSIEAALPGGGRVELLGRDGEGDGGAAHELTLRVELSALGTVDLWLALDDERVAARVALGEGRPLALAQEGAGELRAALGAAAGRPAEVTLVARPDPLDVYA